VIVLDFGCSNRLEYNGAIWAHCNLYLLDSSNSSATVYQVAGITGAPHHNQLIFVYLVETGFHHIGPLRASSDLPASASQSVGITGVSHPTLQKSVFVKSVI
uniref:Uncharacterized protein n=1 Tax=Papio anubis TaxID=9555 RepID=A0A8I5R7Q6_PAPAN